LGMKKEKGCRCDIWKKWRKYFDHLRKL
jgi:hypothetical protein